MNEYINNCVSFSLHIERNSFISHQSSYSSSLFLISSCVLDFSSSSNVTNRRYFLSLSNNNRRQNSNNDLWVGAKKKTDVLL